LGSIPTELGHNRLPHLLSRRHIHYMVKNFFADMHGYLHAGRVIILLPLWDFGRISRFGRRTVDMTEQITCFEDLVLTEFPSG